MRSPSQLHLQDQGNNGNALTQRLQRGRLLERSPLAQLLSDEQLILRRRVNIQNYGSGWLKPPGVPKTLHQMREEKREQEEHQEALRREQLAQELEQAEQDEHPEDEMMDDVMLDGARDLDDEIPDADEDAFQGSNNDSLDEDDASHDDGGHDEAVQLAADNLDENAIREERQTDLIAARMRMTDDAFREAMVRGEADGDDVYGDSEVAEEEEQGNVLGEDDFISQDGGEIDLTAGMDANLDDDIPEAESAGYEHTDSDAGLSSEEEEDSEDEEDEDEDEEDDDDDDIQGRAFVPRAAPMGPPQSPTWHGRASMAGNQSGMDISNFLSQDESSFMESSPVQSRRTRPG